MKTSKTFRCFFAVLILSVLLPVQASRPVTAMNVKVEKGVSKELATVRAREINNISYRISFEIPLRLTQDITFIDTIRFNRNTTTDLQLDFQGTLQTGASRINGKLRPLQVIDEHIVIPGKWLHKGYNEIVLAGTSENKSLNRSADYLYTLFVPDHARSVFPCFDQPDLKAHFSLTLTVPEGWKVLSNAPGKRLNKSANTVYKNDIYTFSQTEKIPTYLFSFTAGKFRTRKAMRDGRELEALYRETDPQKTAQLDKIFDEIAFSLRWLERYTNIPYPFKKYGFAILPGYQFGGMEHPGAIQYRDRTLFLGPNPTPDEELKRLELIAHETAHMWFGDLVTMRWFDDVWTKEVFANLMASKIAREQFPEINHDLNFLKSYQTRAISTDRTEGTHPIQQSLANLNRAGLLYGNIIYHKAPVMMLKLEQRMGESAFRKGLQCYLKRFSYGNATWDSLIQILDSVKPEAALPAFSEIWVKQKGMPTIVCQYTNGKIRITQTDPFGRGLVWPQQFVVGAVYRDSLCRIPQNVEAGHCETLLSNEPLTLFSNYDGSGYGRFLTADQSQTEALAAWFTQPETSRFALMMTLYENYLARNINSKHAFQYLFRGFLDERNDLIASTCIDYLRRISVEMPSYGTPDNRRMDAERNLWTYGYHHKLPSVRKKILQVLGTSAVAPDIISKIYEIWKTQADSSITVNDYTHIAYHLAIMLPTQWQEILDVQRTRLKNTDQTREFDFVSRACTPDTLVQRQLFDSLLQRENRSVEPWAQSMLALLNASTREPHSNRYLWPGLDALQDVQKTGDIFFPGYWLSALLAGHKSIEAKQIVQQWIAAHPHYPVSLMNKLKENAYYLLR